MSIGRASATATLTPGVTCFIQRATGTTERQATLDDWCRTSSSDTTSEAATVPIATSSRRNAHARANTKGKRAGVGKARCRAERTRDWELRGGVRSAKLFGGKGGWQLHIMPLGGHEEAVKAAQPDWSKPLPSNLFGVFKAEAFEHNTWWNSYVYDGYDQRDAPERHFEQDFQWG